MCVGTVCDHLTKVETPKSHTIDGFLPRELTEKQFSDHTHHQTDRDFGGSTIVRVPWRLVLVRDAYVKSNGASHGTPSIFVVAKHRAAQTLLLGTPVNIWEPVETLRRFDNVFIDPTADFIL